MTLRFQQADFAISNLFMTTDRKEVVDYTYPYTTAPIVFTSPVPKIRDNRLNFIEPFDYMFWMVLLTLIALNTEIDHLIYKQKLSTIWTIINILMKQPLRLDRSRRLMAISWFLMSVVITGSYGGVVFSLMARSMESERIESLSDLVAAYKMNKISIIATKNNPIIKAIKVKLNSIELDQQAMIDRAPTRTLQPNGLLLALIIQLLDIDLCGPLRFY